MFKTLRKITIPFITTCLLMVGSSFGQSLPINPIDPYVPPPLTIKGADTPYPYGELIQLSVSKVDKLPDDVVSANYDWKVFENNKEKTKVYISEDRQTIFFGAGIKPTKYLVVLDVNFSFIKKDKDGKLTDAQTRSTGVITAEVTVGDSPNPDPGPNPTPTPAPKPIPPDGTYKLAKVSLDATDKVTSPTKVAEAHAISAVYRTVSQGITAGKITTMADAYKALKDGNDAALSKLNVNLEQWKTWDQSVRKAVYQLYLDKKLTVMADYGVVFGEVANGLDCVQ